MAELVIGAEGSAGKPAGHIECRGRAAWEIEPRAASPRTAAVDADIEAGPVVKRYGCIDRWCGRRRRRTTGQIGGDGGRGRDRECDESGCRRKNALHSKSPLPSHPCQVSLAAPMEKLAARVQARIASRMGRENGGTGTKSRFYGEPRRSRQCKGCNRKIFGRLRGVDAAISPRAPKPGCYSSREELGCRSGIFSPVCLYGADERAVLIPARSNGLR
jgi:hypothetical protein